MYTCLQILKDAVNICVLKCSLPEMTPSVNSRVNFDASPITVDVSKYREFVFLLCRLWKVALNYIETHWILNLFAIGLFDEGKKVKSFITALHTYTKMTNLEFVRGKNSA